MKTFPTPSAAAAAAAQVIATAAAAAVAARGEFRIALAGGSTPRLLNQALVTTHKDDIPWSSVEIFFGDERCVAPTHADSNYGLANSTLIAPLGLADQRVHRLRGEDPDPFHEALRAEAELLAITGDGVLDLVLLGLGPDGHVTSLFPRMAALDATDRLYVSSPPGMAPHVQRITLTFVALGRARQILVLATGASKAAALHGVIDVRDRALPATRLGLDTVVPTFFVDADATTALREEG